MIAIFLADGFEEIEALTPLDVLRRAGLDVKTVGVTSKIAVGSHGIPVVCDISADELDTSALTAVIFPGGMPGSLNLDASPISDKAIDAVKKNGGIIAAICAAPLVLGRRGLLKDKKATCYPGFEKELVGAKYTADTVTVDGNIVTARGMGVALEFALTLTEMIKGKDEAIKISEGVCEKHVYTPHIKEESDECDDGDFVRAALADEKFMTAIEITLAKGEVSTSLLQRKLAIGYGKAASYIDAMENLGIISEARGQSPRIALMSAEDWQERLKEINS